MYTVIETVTFSQLWPYYWTEEERGAFVSWLAQHPEAGAVVRGSGGVRVIYFNRLAGGQVWLLYIYAKSGLDSVAGHVLKELRDEIEKATNR
jgi:hypothetical protein